MTRHAARVLTGTAVILALGLSVPAAAKETRLQRGRRIAVELCSPCHAIGRSGASPRVEAPLFRELGRRYPLSNLEEALAEGVVVGHPDMPQVELREDQIGAFLAYLASIQTR